MIPHLNPEGLVEWFEHPKPTGKALVYRFIQDCGFGNQLFEMAAAYGIAKRTGCHLRWTWEPSRLRNFELEPVGFAHTHHEDIPLIAGRLGQGNIKIVREIERRIKETKLDTFMVSCPFQEDACFLEDTTVPEQYFRPNLTPLPLEVPDGATPVGVQVRRTDYVGHGRLDVCTVAYYHNAIEWMRDQVEKPHFFIVSDDPTWCRHRFGNLPDVTVMPPQDSIEGMRTLVACEAHIISNSTFGWWGAWLGEKGPVVVPEKWHHRPGSYGQWDIIPERWHRVTVRSDVARINPIPLEDYEVVEPLHDRAIVIPWSHRAEVWHELRYCMRSIDKFFEDKDCPIYVLGTIRPPWLVNDSGRVNFIQSPTYRHALVTGLQLADKTLWMNDDILFVNPATWEDCERTLYLRDIGKGFLETAQPQNNPWRAGCMHVLKQLKRRGVRKLRVFSTHTPYVFDRKKAVEVLREFGAWDKMPFELAYFHLHGGKPVLCEDYRTHGAPFDDKLFLNFTDSMMTLELRAALAERLPDFAPWEVQAKF